MSPGSPQEPAPGQRAKGAPGWTLPALGLGLLALLIVSSGVLAQGCIRSKGATERHLASLRGKPVPPGLGLDARAALEQASRASGAEVDLPSSYRRLDGGAEWCTTGTLRVDGRAVPFGVKLRELSGALTVVDMSLTRLRCVSQGHKNNASTDLR